MDAPVTVKDFLGAVRDQCALARKLGFEPATVTINPGIMLALSADKEFHTLQEFSQSRIVQHSPKIRFLRIFDDLVLTIVESRHEFLFHLDT